MNTQISDKSCKKLNIAEILFFTVYMVAPTYFAIELSESIPLFTVSRIILLLSVFMVLNRTGGRFSIKCFDRSVTYYCLLIILIDVLHFIDSGKYALKDIFSILLDQILVYWLVCNIIKTKDTFIKSIRLLLYTSGVVAIVSIIGFLNDTNFFYLLKTVKRNMLMTANTSIGRRAGLLRIEAGFGHPVYYGIYCCIMAFIGLYFITNDKRNKFLTALCLALNLAALLLTNSRGDMIAFLIAAVLALFTNRKYDVKRYIKWIVVALIFAFPVVLFVPYIRTYVITIISSIIYYFGGGTLSSNLSDYGANMKASSDRIMQFTGIWWTFKHKFLLGFGPEAHSRGLIKYNFEGIWYDTNTFDVGYVAIIAQYGVIGAIAYAIIFIRMLRASFDRKFKHDPIWGMFRNIFIVYFLCLLSSVSIDKILWVIFPMAMSYYRISKENLKGNENVL